MVVYWRLYRA